MGVLGLVHGCERAGLRLAMGLGRRRLLKCAFLS